MPRAVLDSQPPLHLRLRSDEIGQAFDLTPAESRLAALLATGTSIASAAERLRISRETARNHLKAIFSKTGVHRQSELVTLVSQLG